MKSRFAKEGKPLVTGWDLGGAHLKTAQCRDGEIISANILKTPLWLGVDQTAGSLAGSGTVAGRRQCQCLHHDWRTFRYVRLARRGNTRVARLHRTGIRRGGHPHLCGTSGFQDRGFRAPPWQRYRIRQLARHRKPSCETGKYGLFVDMGSTTTDILAFRDGELANTAIPMPSGF